MKKLLSYITEAKAQLPEGLEKFKEISKFGDWDELKDKDYEEIYNILISIEKPTSWTVAKELLQLLHDGNLDALESLGNGYWGNREKEDKAHAKKLDAAISKLPNKFTDNYSDLGGFVNYTTAHFFNKLKPKEEIDAYSTPYYNVWTNIQYFDKYFTDKRKEAARKKILSQLPNDMKEWYDKCRNFCYAGAWQYTDPKLSVRDFNPDFFEACKKFDFTKIEGLNTRANVMTEVVTNLVHALFNNDKKEALKYFDEYCDKASGYAYWYQNDFGRDSVGGCIAEAALVIGMSKFLGANNFWYCSDFTLEVMKRKFK